MHSLKQKNGHYMQYHLLIFLSENFFRRAEQKFCGYRIRLRRTACSSKVGSSHCYLDRRPLHEIATLDEIVYEYDRKHSQKLVYVALSIVILMRYLILYSCVDHGTYYKFYFQLFRKFSIKSVHFIFQLPQAYYFIFRVRHK